MGSFPETFIGPINARFSTWLQDSRLIARAFFKYGLFCRLNPKYLPIGLRLASVSKLQ